MALSAPPLKEVATVDVGQPDANYRVTLNSNIAAVRKQVVRFTKKGVRRAEFRALNRGAEQTLTLIRRDISKSFNLKQKEFKSHLSIIKANFNTLFVAIRGSGDQIPIIRATGAKKQTPQGVRVNTGGGAGVKQGTFLATVGNHTGVFQREPGWKHQGPFPSKRGGAPQMHGLGIAELKYPPVESMIRNPKRAARSFDAYANGSLCRSQ